MIDNDIVTTMDVTEESPKVQPEQKAKIRYGILVYIDENNQFGMEFENKEQCTLSDLVSLSDLAHRKLSTIWESQNNPSNAAILRELKSIKIMNARTAEANLETLKGILEALQNLHEPNDLSVSGDDGVVIDVTETEGTV